MRGNVKMILTTFLSLIFQSLQHDICLISLIQRCLPVWFGTWILQKPKQRLQYFNWSSYQSLSNTPHEKQLVGPPLFSLLEIATRKDCLSCFIRVSKVSLRLTLIQNGGSCSLRILPLMTEFSVFMPFLHIAPGNSCLGGICLRDYKIIWKIKVREIKRI